MNPPERIARKFVDALSEQLDKSDFYDVTVIADDRVFNCHRVVLAAASGFFNALLSSGMKEAIEQSITLQDISQQTFSEILECVYKGKYVLNSDNILEVWHAANQLQILFLIEECKMFVKETLSVDNCFAMYQHSKLLDSEEIKYLAWNFIHLHFDDVRLSDEILMLTADEMKTLVSSQDLKTTSEDFVVETIFRWAKYEDDQDNNATCTFSNIGSEVEHKLSLKTEDYFGKQNPSLETKTSELLESNAKDILEQHGEQQQNCGEVEKCDSKNNGSDSFAKDEKTNKSFIGTSRVDSLPGILDAARLCLASGKCLMEIKSSNLIEGNIVIQKMVEIGMRYQIQPDRRHDFIPASAIHRSSSQYEIVLLSGRQYMDRNFFDGMNIAGEWFNIDSNFAIATYSKKSISYGDSIICLLYDNNLWMFNPLQPNNKWIKLPQLIITPDTVVDIFVEGNLLHAFVQKGTEYLIEMLDLKNINTALWIRVGSLGNDFGSVKSSVVVGDSVAIFREIIGNTKRTAVECFSTKTLKACHVLDIDGPPNSMVTFKKNDEGFLLLGNGFLYRVTPSSSTPPITVKYETILWDFDRVLSGAVICGDELLLLGPAFNSIDAEQDKKWELSVHGVFKSIRNIVCCSYNNYMGLTPTIVHKRSLSTKTSVL